MTEVPRVPEIEEVRTLGRLCLRCSSTDAVSPTGALRDLSGSTCSTASTAFYSRFLRTEELDDDSEHYVYMLIHHEDRMVEQSRDCYPVGSFSQRTAHQANCMHCSTILPDVPPYTHGWCDRGPHGLPKEPDDKPSYFPSH